MTRMCEWPECKDTAVVNCATTFLNHGMPEFCDPPTPSPWPDGEMRDICAFHMVGTPQMFTFLMRANDPKKEDG